MIRKRNLRNIVSSRNSNKRLYESIMKDVAKKVKNQLNESNNMFYAEDWYDMETGTDVINAIEDALSYTDIYDSLNMSIKNGLDPSIFTKPSFLRELGKSIFYKWS